tara:strand:- start:527 stop:832 length:306 start_codon:yes stop_codon:yes gene_type:complete
MGLLKPNTNQRIANSSKETSEATLKSFAVAGATFIDDNAQHTAGYYAIQGINSAKLDVSECVFGSGMTTFDADFVIPNGAIIYGNFSTFSLDSGSCIAYKK